MWRNLLLLRRARGLWSEGTGYDGCWRGGIDNVMGLMRARRISDSLSYAVVLVAENIILSGELGIGRLEVLYKIDGFTQNFPFARLHASVGGELISELVE